MILHETTSSFWLRLVAAVIALGCNPVVRLPAQENSRAPAWKPPTKESIPKDMPAEVRALVEETFSADPVQRENAATSLGALGNRALPAIPFLIRLLPEGEGPPDVWPSWAAEKALVRLGTPAVEPLIAAMRAPGSLPKASLAEALGLIGDARAVPVLIAALEDHNASARGRAAWALDIIPDPRSVEPLLRHLGDADEDFARQVIQALGSTGDRRTAEPLIAIANNRKASEAVREAAIISLGELADPRALETVLTIYKDAAASESTRRFCLRPIARCGRDDKARALAAIRNALVSKDELTRLNAIAALSHFHDAPSIALLESLLGDRTEPMIVHRVAAAALVSSGDPGAIERVYRESLLREAQAIELRLEVLDSLAQSHVATGYRWLVDAADVEGWR